MTTNTDTNTIDQFLTRAVERVYPSKQDVAKRFGEGKPLTMYFGIDPTGPSLHIGHAISLLKLRAFQQMGHKVILLIGDFTGMIGDPTDKSAARVRQTRAQVLANAKKYKKQASKIISFTGDNPAELKYNSKWLAKLNFEELIEIAAHLTVPRLLERDMFQKRLQDGKTIHLHEFLYPLMQGYDSVAMDTDGEIGGNDQTFNMLTGRDLMKSMEGKDKFVLSVKLLADPTGKKMGKTEGNMITFEDAPEDVFGKVMSWTDGMIVPGFELLTSASVQEVESRLTSENPRDVKADLAEEIVTLLHSAEDATKAREQFDGVFKDHATPENIAEHSVHGSATIVDVLVEAGLVKSKSEARRVIESGGVKVDGDVIRDIATEVAPKADGVLIQKGKRHFVRVIK